MLNLAKAIADLYPSLDRDLLYAGVILHDLGNRFCQVQHGHYMVREPGDELMVVFSRSRVIHKLSRIFFDQMSRGKCQH
jgi:hypothetical protein